MHRNQDSFAVPAISREAQELAHASGALITASHVAGVVQLDRYRGILALQWPLIGDDAANQHARTLILLCNQRSHGHSSVISRTRSDSYASWSTARQPKRPAPPPAPRPHHPLPPAPCKRSMAMLVKLIRLLQLRRSVCSHVQCSYRTGAMIAALATSARSSSAFHEAFIAPGMW